MGHWARLFKNEWGKQVKYRIISVGKIREPFYNNGIQEYLKRLKSYTSIELIDGLEEKISPKAGAGEIDKCIQKEGAKIIDLVSNDEIVIAFDIKGELLSSEEWAQYIEGLNVRSSGRVNMIVGGSFGLDEKVKQRAERLISFSRMTFPHQMAVLMLTEQIYRGFKINKREPYHK